MFTNPFRSLVATLWLTCRITGMAGLLGLVSPVPLAVDVPSGRSTVVRNVTVAAITGFGGEEKSVTRTITG